MQPHGSDFKEMTAAASRDLAAPLRIGIIGSGISGRLLAINLLRSRSPERSLRVSMIDPGNEEAMGPAYSDEADYLLLNVPAGRMGAIAEDEGHFLTWVRQQGVAANQLDFLPRRTYRNYVLSLMIEAVSARGSSTSFERLQGAATDLEVDSDRVTITLDGGRRLVVDRAVLALGNFPPPQPSIKNASALSSPRYVRIPWNTQILDVLAPRDTVLLIGTGQTTIDLVVALHRRGHQGRIVAISRRGFLPLRHAGFDTYEPFFDELENSSRLSEVFRVVRRHLDRARERGIDERAVIDSLRPFTQRLWMQLPVGEKRRFLRQVFRYWEIIRSRIPSDSMDIVDAMRASGQLEIVAGRIHDLVSTPAAMEVHYIPRGHTSPVVENAALIVNCVGPESDYRKVDHPLVVNLLRRGLIRPGPANLGLDAQPDGTVIDRDGGVSNRLYTLGAPMKGVLWEVIAVPDIRVQAEQLARRLVRGDTD